MIGEGREGEKKIPQNLLNAYHLPTDCYSAHARAHLLLNPIAAAAAAVVVVYLSPDIAFHCSTYFFFLFSSLQFLYFKISLTHTTGGGGGAAAAVVVVLVAAFLERGHVSVASQSYA